MKKGNNTPKNSGNKTVTRIYYIAYVLLLIGYTVGMYFMHHWLTDRLVAFEAATQPAVKSEEVFQALFADPDWGQLYEDAGLTDTEFEGRDTFIAYMTSLVGDEELTYAEIPSQAENRKYEIRVNGQALGCFTLADQAAANATIPDWEFAEVSIQVEKNQRVSIVKLDGHTAYVNGYPLDDSYTVEIMSTVAEKYLPQGTLGIRRLRQEVSDLLMQPQVAIFDEDGNECAVSYDESTGIYTEIPATAEPISEGLEAQAIAAGEAYGEFLVNRSTAILSKHFLPGSQAYREITAMDPLTQGIPEISFTGQSLSEYTRYTEDLFSVRVKMTMEMTFRTEISLDDEDLESVQVIKTTETYPIDTLFFFENRKAGWMVTGMTDADITQATSRVRLSFLYDDVCLSTAFYDSADTTVYAPLISGSEGQMVSGWAGNDGTIVFTCYENGLLNIPEGTTLKPMTLYAVFEAANDNQANESEEIQ